MSNDAQELREVLDAVGDTIPKLIRDIFSSFYSAQSGADMGKAVGSMYRELVDSGIPEADALQMAKDYLNTLQNALKSINIGGAGKAADKMNVKTQVVLDTDDE